MKVIENPKTANLRLVSACLPAPLPFTCTDAQAKTNYFLGPLSLTLLISEQKPRPLFLPLWALYSTLWTGVCLNLSRQRHPRGDISDIAAFIGVFSRSPRAREPPKSNLSPRAFFSLTILFLKLEVSRGKFHKTFVCVRRARCRTCTHRSRAFFYLNYCARKRRKTRAIFPSIQQAVRGATA